MPKGWIELQEAEGAIGADRILDLSDDGAFVIPSPFAFSDFLTELYSGTSPYSSLYSKSDVERFMQTKTYLEFVTKGMKKQVDGVAIRRDEYWDCGNGDDPKFVLIERRFRSLVVRLRPVDIFDMALNSASSLNTILPTVVDDFIDNRIVIGNTSKTSAHHAVCPDCGDRFSGIHKTYDAGHRQKYDFGVEVTPIVASYMLAEGQFTKLSETLVRSSQIGITPDAVMPYLGSKGVHDDFTDRINYVVRDIYLQFIADGWNAPDALLAATVVEYFPVPMHADVIAFLNRKNGSDGFHIHDAERLMRVFLAHGNGDKEMFFAIIEQDIDIELANKIVSSTTEVDNAPVQA